MCASCIQACVNFSHDIYFLADASKRNLKLPSVYDIVYACMCVLAIYYVDPVRVSICGAGVKGQGATKICC